MKNRIRAKFSPLVATLLTILALYVVSLLIPLIWGLISSLKGNIDFSINVFGLPKGHIWEWKWSNYSYVFENFSVLIIKGREQIYVDMPMQLLYSILYAGGRAFFGAIVPCIVGYLIARFPYKLSRIVHTTIIICMIIPIVGAEYSTLKIVRLFGMYDTIVGNWIMSMSFFSIYTLVFISTFKELSPSYSEAAYIDGANEFKVFFDINFRLVSGAFYTVFLLMFIASWNDYNTPLLYMPTKPTLAYGVYAFNESAVTTLSWPPMKITGCMILVLPIFTLFLIFHNRLMGNLTMGGVKE